MFALVPTHAFGDYRRVYPSYAFDVASPWDVFESELGAGSALDMCTAHMSGRAGGLEFPCRGSVCGMDTVHGYGIPQRHMSKKGDLNRKERRKQKLPGCVRCKSMHEVSVPKKVARKGSENVAKMTAREKRQTNEYYQVRATQVKGGLMLQIVMEPGIGKENVEVDIDQHRRLLVVSVKKNVPEYHTVRDVWGRIVARVDRGMTKQVLWNRNMRMDERVDMSTISAKMEDNVLTLYAAFKKMDTRGPRRIPVEGGDVSTGTELPEEPQHDEIKLQEETEQDQEAMAVDQQVVKEKMALADGTVLPEISGDEKDEFKLAQQDSELQEEERKSVTSADEEIDGSIEDCEY